MLDKKIIAMVVAEFLGAAVLAAVIYSIIARTTFPLFTGLAGGGVVALLVLAFSPVSGTHANPALTFGLWSARKMQTIPAIGAIIAQMLGGLAAWGLLNYFVGHHLTSIAGEKFAWKVLIAEGVGTAVFTFGVASAVYQKFEGAKLAATVGISFFMGVIVASLGANGLLNPAVALGVQSWSWAYAVGPLAGALVGVNLYGLLFTETKGSSFKLTVSRGAKRSSSRKKRK